MPETSLSARSGCRNAADMLTDWLRERIFLLHLLAKIVTRKGDKRNSHTNRMAMPNLREVGMQ